MALKLELALTDAIGEPGASATAVQEMLNNVLACPALVAGV
jgi:hypothetical protein